MCDISILNKNECQNIFKNKAQEQRLEAQQKFEQEKSRIL